MPSTLTETEQALKLREWIANGRARKLRQAANLSLAAAARDIEVDAAAVMRWERQMSTPRGRNVGAYYRFLARLDQALGHAVTDV